MSYLFDATTERLVGDLTSSIDISATSCTIACWLKLESHPNVNKYLLSLSVDTELNDFISLNLFDPDDTYSSFIMDTGAVSDGAKYSGASAGEYDNVWVPWVGVYRSDSYRRTYIEDITNVGGTSLTRVTGNLSKITLHDAPNTAGAGPGNASNDCRVAEVAIWDKELTFAEIKAYFDGIVASEIAVTNLRGYWPLNYENATQANEGLDATGDLAVTGATFSNDFPPVGPAQPDNHQPSLITFPSPQKQPKKVVEIDWSNPITEGLVTVFNGATPYADAVTGVSASTFNTDLAGGYQNLVGPSGESSSTLIEFNGAFDASEQFNTDATVFSLYRPHLRFTIANYGILFFSGTDINYPMLRLGWLDNGDDSVHFRVTTADNKRTNFLSANGIAPKGELGSTLGIVRGDGTNSLSGELWHNGVNVVANGALVPTTSKISLSALDDSYTVLGDNDLNDRGACVDLFLSCCWNRSLSPREAQSMTENPWQIFKPTEVFIIGKPEDRRVVMF